MQWHVFISYAREDNATRRADGKGWVHLFQERLEAEYLDVTGRELRVFLDEKRIENGDLWETSLKDALRQSRILIAILSPNYLASKICQMELEEYIRHEQAATPGGNGVRPIYFAPIPELDNPSTGENDLSRLIEDLNRRNRDSGLNWCNWAETGVPALLRIEAEDRLADLKTKPEPPLDRFVADVKTLQLKISERLNDVALAELARGQGNLSGSHVHFVGRGAEIATIHTNLVHNRAQVVTALHGLGGQGKSALARQYAHAFASYYAAGGRWEVECEGLGTGLTDESRKDRHLLLALAFDRLIDRMLNGDSGDDPRYRKLRLGPEHDRLPPKERLQAILARLRAFTVEGWKERLAALRAQVGEVHGDWPKLEDHHARILVIFDNVDKPKTDGGADSPSLMNAEAYADLKGAEWLEVIVTTRLDPSDIGVPGKDGTITTLTVDHLPLSDAVALLREMVDAAARPRTLDAEERAALRALAQVLGGFTLAVELAGAYLATYPTVSVAAYLKRLEADGIATVDTAVTEGSRKGQVASVVRHREGQVGVVLAQSIALLSPEDVDVLSLASHFAPDHVVEDWLRATAAALHPAFVDAPEGRESPWDATLTRLTGRRLLVPSDRPGTLRLHRMVRDHLRKTATAERLARDRELVIQRSDAIGRASEDHAKGWSALPKLWGAIWPSFSALVETLLDEGAPDARTVQDYGILLDRVQQEGNMATSLTMVQRRLMLAENLLALNPDSAQARRDLSVSQERIGDFYLRRGGPGDDALALAAYQAALKTRRKLAEENPDSAEARRDLSVSQNKIGDFYLRRGGPGDDALALAAYQAALEADRQLAEDNPDSAQARRDLSVSQNKIGDFYLRRGGPGDEALALAAYQAALETRRQLAEDNPDSAQARRDLSVSQNKIGDFYLRRGGPGDDALALVAYQAALETRRQLAEDNPDSAEARRDLSVSQNKIGDVYLRRGGPGDDALALSAYQAALEIARKLAEDNPDSAQARRDLSVSQSKIGDFYLRRGGPGYAALALTAYQASLATDRQLAEDNPDSAQARRDLSVSQNKIGDFYLRRGGQGDDALALAAYEAALETRHKLTEDNPDSAEARRDLAVSLFNLGRLSVKTGDREAALAYLSEALSIIETFAAEGRMMDPQMRATRAGLRKMLGLPPDEENG
jgi:tetratricopeptide (TPR) repeat protein